jgi:hypothetical protein
MLTVCKACTRLSLLPATTVQLWHGDQSLVHNTKDKTMPLVGFLVWESLVWFRMVYVCLCYPHVGHHHRRSSSCNYTLQHMRIITSLPWNQPSAYNLSNDGAPQLDLSQVALQSHHWYIWFYNPIICSYTYICIIICIYYLWLYNTFGIHINNYICPKWLWLENLIFSYTYSTL